MSPARNGNPAVANWLIRSYYTPVGDALRGQLSGRLDWRRIIVEFDLPYPVVDLVVEVARRTRLSRSERADVARELCTHFADGLAAGVAADTLIETFGDPAAAAALIRRSKLRGRPLQRRLARRFGQAVLALMIFGPLVYGLLAARFYLASPTLARNYWHEVNSERRAAPADRAWPLYRTALENLGEKDGDFLHEHRREPVNGPHWAETVAILKRHPQALVLTRKAAHKPQLGYLLGDPEDRQAAIAAHSDWVTGRKSPLADDNEPLLSALLSGIQGITSLAGMLDFDTRWAIETGDSATALANIQAGLALSKQIAQPRGTPIEQLVAFNLFTQVLQRIHEILAHSPQRFTEDEWHQVAQQITACWGGPISIDFSGERMMFEDALQRGFTDDGRGDGRLTPAALEMLTFLEEPPNRRMFRGLDPILSPGLSAVVGSRRENRELFYALLDELIAAHQGPAWKWNRAATLNIDQRLDALMASPTERIRYYLVGVMFPAIPPIFNAAERTIQQRDATLTAIALVLWQRRHGTWPESLAALVPDWLPQLPVDRFDGQPLRYRIVAGKPLLYSIGEDRDDDGGQPANEVWQSYDTRPAWFAETARQRGWIEGGDWVLWPPAPIPPHAAAQVESPDEMTPDETSDETPAEARTEASPLEPTPA